MESSRLKSKAVRNYEVCVHATEDITSVLIYVVWWSNDILFPHVGRSVSHPIHCPKVGKVVSYKTA
jgi:hypothetical protein